MPGEEWTEARLLRMLEEQIRENSELDYKRSAALARTDESKNELGKDVSAFANAGGGTLIYGIAEDAKRHVPERLDDGSDPSVITKEWLEDVISSSIRRKVDNVKIHVVQLTGPRQGRVAYVVVIPQSMRAPHMASDHKYYKRHNFKSEPMEEYEVRDVARRGHSPLLRVHLDLGGIVMPGNEFEGTLPRARLDIVLVNDGREPASAARVELAIDARAIVVGWPEPWRDVRARTQTGPGGLLAAREYTFNWVGPDAFPVFEGAPAHVVRLTVEPMLSAGGGPFLVWWRVLSPRAPQSEGLSWFSWRVAGGGSFAVRDTRPGDGLPDDSSIPWANSDEEAFATLSKLVALQDVPRFRDLKK